MENFKDILNEIGNNMKYFDEANPHLINSFFKFMDLCEAGNKLDEKTKELIAVSLAVNQKCKYCIAFHVKKCLDLGISKDEILEAAWVSVLMGGGPSLMYLQLVKEAIDQLSK